MAQRKTEGKYIDGRHVTTHIGAEKGAEDTSATTRAKLQDVSGLAAAARRNKAKKEGMTAGDAAAALARRKRNKESE